jgi:transposase
MSREVMTMNRFVEIKRQLALGVSVIQISRNLNCAERTVRQIRDNKMVSPAEQKQNPEGPTWSLKADWQLVMREVLDGHPIKFIWAERFENDVGYKAFLDQFHKKNPEYSMSPSVHRYFAPGERCEVDYAGDTLLWIDLQTGELFEAQIFIGILGFSQKIFAEGTTDQKSRNFVESHTRMYQSFSGVPSLTVPDCLKQGVSRTHLYDPNINKSYQAMAVDFGTAIVPARPSRPKDKSLVEGAVKLVMRAYRWHYRGKVPTSLGEMNRWLLEVTDLINNKSHWRFKISRNESWGSQEREKLHALPQGSYEYPTFKTATVHDDCYVSVEDNYYSAPKQYRREKVSVKITEARVEIFFDLDRIALHPRRRGHHGERVTEISHLPENAQAYLEATPQNTLSQAKFLSPELHELIENLFKENTLWHLRRAMGLVRKSRSEIQKIGALRARENIKKAIEKMKMFNRVRVAYFEELLEQSRVEQPKVALKIDRGPNPNLRHVGGAQLALIVDNEKPNQKL